MSTIYDDEHRADWLAARVDLERDMPTAADLDDQADDRDEDKR